VTQIPSDHLARLYLPPILGAGAAGGLCAGLGYTLTHSVDGASIMGVLGCAAVLGGWLVAQSQRKSEIDGTLRAKQTVNEANLDRADPIAGGATLAFAKAGLDAIPNPAIVLDASGRVILANRPAQARFSLGSPRTLFANVVRRPDLIGAINQVMRTRETISLAMETRVPVDRYERASVAPFTVGGVDYVMISIFDDTEVRMSDRMRADFLANASHELRTPLAAIIGFIETLRGPARDDVVARDKFLAVMHVQADRMRRLISDLLSLSRIELNEHVAPRGTSDLVAAVHEAADLLPQDQKNRLEIHAAAPSIEVIGDRDEMAQVVINLIDNGLKYSPPDSKVRIFLRNGLEREAATNFLMRQWEQAGRLPLTTPDIDRDRRYGAIRFENSGDGIERQYLPRLAERFFRVDDNVSGKSGTGLGLAIVKHIVSRHRGGLKVESEVGRGAAFGVYLPQPTQSEPDQDGDSETVT
jgi:two-component system, OmpR family, phosphate regulon sensor histidine kinase PhoR